MKSPAPVIALLLACVGAGCFTERPKVTHASIDPPPAYHIHLPGIGGYRSIDRFMLRGLREGGFDAQIEPYDWTEEDPGLGALLATQRHKTESKRVAQLILKHVREHPDSRLTVSAHSGGAGIIVWALEQLPDDAKIDTLVLLAPALSPRYDLTKALRHVRGHVYAFYSPYDIAVLGIGTSMLGTIDGVKTDAAGKVGFAKPTSADDRQYAKLVQIPYDAAWVRLGNIGDHIGALTRPFGKAVLAPLLLTGQLPRLEKDDTLKSPATLPAGAPPTPPAEPATTPAIPATQP